MLKPIIRQRLFPQPKADSPGVPDHKPQMNRLLRPGKIVRLLWEIREELNRRLTTTPSGSNWNTTGADLNRRKPGRQWRTIPCRRRSVYRHRQPANRSGSVNPGQPKSTQVNLEKLMSRFIRAIPEIRGQNEFSLYHRFPTPVELPPCFPRSVPMALTPPRLGKTVVKRAFLSFAVGITFDSRAVPLIFQKTYGRYSSAHAAAGTNRRCTAAEKRDRQGAAEKRNRSH
jgi:hypothetical protein